MIKKEDPVIKKGDPVIKKGDLRLLRRIGDSFNTNTKQNGIGEDYYIEYDSFIKIKRKAVFENLKFKNTSLITKVNEPVAFINPNLNSYLDFEYNYTDPTADYDDRFTTVPFKWSIEYDMKLSDYSPQGGYRYLYSWSGGPYSHSAISVSNNSGVGVRSYGCSDSWSSTVFDNLELGYEVVDKWYKFKFEVNDNIQNSNRIINLEFLGYKDEIITFNTDYQLKDLKNISIGGNSSINNPSNSMFMKNVKIKYNNKLILDCPDPVTGKNLVGDDAIPNNIEYK
jgi:hypothetical protein